MPRAVFNDSGGGDSGIIYGGLVWKGTYNPTTTYAVNSLVSYNNKTYISVADATDERMLGAALASAASPSSISIQGIVHLTAGETLSAWAWSSVATNLLGATAA